jgi:hypothetical protein
MNYPHSKDICKTSLNLTLRKLTLPVYQYDSQKTFSNLNLLLFNQCSSNILLREPDVWHIGENVVHLLACNVVFGSNTIETNLI